MPHEVAERRSSIWLSGLPQFVGALFLLVAIAAGAKAEPSAADAVWLKAIREYTAQIESGQLTRIRLAGRLHLRAMAFYHLKKPNYQRAIADVDRSIRLFPEADTFLLRSDIYLAMKDYELRFSTRA